MRARVRATALLLAAFVLVLAGCAAAQPARSGAAHVRIVVGDADDPAPGDLLLADHLRVGLGLRVSWLDDEDAPDGAAGPVDLYLISESVSSDAIEGRYRDLDVPLVVLENAAWEAMGLAESYGTRFGGAPVRAEPAAQDLLRDPDELSALARDGTDLKLAFGVPLDGEILARTADQDERPVAFRLEEGARLHGLRAPARRAGLGIVDDAVPTLDEAAWDLLLGSVSWALDRPLPAPTWRALMVVGYEGGRATQADLMVRTRMRTLGLDVRLVGDAAVPRLPLARFQLAVMSKTVDSATVGTALRDAAIPTLFWEDNQQALPFMATIDEGVDGPTAWHAPAERLQVVAPDLDPSDRLDPGPLRIYERVEELGYAPAGSLAPGAVPVARFGDDPDDRRVAAYVVSRGATLADGRSAAAPLAFLGLYDATFRHLTADGVALFDLLVSWLLADGPEVAAARGPL